MLADMRADRTHRKTKTGLSDCPPVVYAVDDEPLVRSYLARLLTSEGFLVATFASAHELLEEIALEGPGCLILDACLPGLSGLDLQRMLLERCSHLPIIFISGQGTIPMSVQAMKAGAFDFLVKPLDRDALIADVQGALDLSAGTCAEHAEDRALQALFQTLSPRQVQVLRLVAAGKLNKQIAADLHIVEKTVKVHRSRAMQKLGARSVAELVRLADKLGPFPPRTSA